MIPGLTSAGTTEVALRLMARRGRGDWLALIVAPGGDVSSAAEELAQEMEAMGEVTVERITDARDAVELTARLAAAQGPVVVVGLDGWSASEWAHLDQLRSRLARDERMALVISGSTFERIMRDAPNFSSWLGASAWSYQPGAAELTEVERQRRLEALRQWSGLSDDEVLARAQAGTLPAEPEFAEWLVLLHRGDLLER